jgi:MFS-type transporter involved in bile tolerance (Atg22 family)
LKHLILPCLSISQMAAVSPAIDPVKAPAEYPLKSTKLTVSPSPTASLTDHPVAPDQFDPKWETDKIEIWSYYSYYIGNNGLTLFNFAPTAFQNLLYQAAGDGTSLFFAGRKRTINSIVLLSNGISFAIQIVVFLFLGSFADFGTWRPNILIGLSLVAWGIGFGWLGVHDSSKWEIATGLYIVGLIAYQTTLTFWTAAFPGLARNTPELREKAEQYQAGEITRGDYDYADTLKRSELSNMAFYIQSVGEVVILAVIVGISKDLFVFRSSAFNYGYSHVLHLRLLFRTLQKITPCTLETVLIWEILIRR